MIARILSLLGANPIKTITEGIVQARKDAHDAKNDSERIEAEQRIAQLEMRRDVLLAEQKSWVTRWIRPAIAFPFAVYLWKILIWDKVLGLGATDDLTRDQWQLMMIVIGAYFLTRPFGQR